MPEPCLPGHNVIQMAIDDLRKTAVTETKLHYLYIDIAAVKKIKSGMMNYYERKTIHSRGMNIAEMKSQLPTIKARSQRLLTLNLKAKTGIVKWCHHQRYDGHHAFDDFAARVKTGHATWPSVMAHQEVEKS